MITSIFASIIAYISTNIDDIFVLMILLAQTPKGTKGRLVAGHFLGVGILTAVSMLGALGLQNLPLRYVGILGLVPICLGIKAWFHRDDEEMEAKAAGLLSMATITLGNGADNIGVYIPLFAGYGLWQLGVLVGVFAVMIALWCTIAKRLADLPLLKRFLMGHKGVIVPVVFIALGVYIMVENFWL